MANIKKYEAVIFDFDGTLSDSKLGISKCVVQVLEKYGIKIDDLKQVEPMVGPPLREGFTNYFGFEESDIEDAIAEFRIHYADYGYKLHKIYDGADELIKKLYDDKRSLGIATCKPTKFAKIISKEYEIHDYFDVISGSCLDNTMTTKDEVLEFALDNIKDIDLDKTVMVGDRSHDILSAHKYGIDSIAVLHGYALEGEIEACKPTYTVKNTVELSDLLFNV